MLDWIGMTFLTLSLLDNNRGWNKCCAICDSS